MTDIHTPALGGSVTVTPEPTTPPGREGRRQFFEIGSFRSLKMQAFRAYDSALKRDAYYWLEALPEVEAYWVDPVLDYRFRREEGAADGIDVCEAPYGNAAHRFKPHLQVPYRSGTRPLYLFVEPQAIARRRDFRDLIDTAQSHLGSLADLQVLHYGAI